MLVSWWLLTGFHLPSHICNTQPTIRCGTQKYESPRGRNHPDPYINRKLIYWQFHCCNETHDVFNTAQMVNRWSKEVITSFLPQQHWYILMQVWFSVWCSVVSLATLAWVQFFLGCDVVYLAYICTANVRNILLYFFQSWAPQGYTHSVEPLRWKPVNRFPSTVAYMQHVTHIPLRDSKIWASTWKRPSWPLHQPKADPLTIPLI